MALSAPHAVPEPGKAAGLKIRGSKESCAAHTWRATTTLHKAGETSGAQRKKPEQPSAEELGIREEIHYFHLFTYTRKQKHYSDIPAIPFLSYSLI